MLRLIAATTSARLAAAAGSLLVVVLTARWLGPEARGHVATAATWAQLLATFAHLSLGQVALHRASIARSGPWLREAWATLGRVLIVILSVSILLSIGLLAAQSAGTPVGYESIVGELPPPVLAVGVLLVPALVWEHHGGGLLMAVNRLDIQNRALLAGRAVTLLVAVAALAAGGGAVSIMLALVVGQATASSGGFAFLWRRRLTEPLLPGRPPVGSYLRSGLTLHPHAVGTFLALSAGVLVVNRFCGPADAAFFQLALQVIGTMLLLPMAVTSVVYGRVAAEGANAAWRTQRRLVAGFTAVMTCGAGLVVWLAEPIVVVLAGQAFAPAAPLVRWLAVAVPAMTFSALMAPQWIGRGLFAAASAITTAGGLFSVSLATWLVSRAQAPYGAAISFALSYCLMSLAAVWMVWHCERELRGQGARAAR